MPEEICDQQEQTDDEIFEEELLDADGEFKDLQGLLNSKSSCSLGIRASCDTDWRRLQLLVWNRTPAISWRFCYLFPLVNAKSTCCSTFNSDQYALCAATKTSIQGYLNFTFCSSQYVGYIQV
jgi:hypothetical protein